MRKFNCLLMVVTLLLFCGWGGCRQPARDPLPGGQQREIRRQEPVLTAYINQTGEHKRIRCEDYVAGVVAAEMDPNWPMAALAAQAILARTFTLQRIQDDHGVAEHHSDVSTDPVEFQAYDPARINKRVRQAVVQTRGVVITYQGRLVRAWFHANAGGRTATASEGLDFNKEPTPYLRSISDPGQQAVKPKDKNWQSSFPLETVRRAVLGQTGKDPGSVSTAFIAHRGPSGRATLLKIGQGTISGNTLRKALGSVAFRSTLLDRFQVAGGKLVVAGRGYGHGVGLSQWGAYYLALHGKSYSEIINYYYQGVQLKRNWK